MEEWLVKAYMVRWLMIGLVAIVVSTGVVVADELGVKNRIVYAEEAAIENDLSEAKKLVLHKGINFYLEQMSEEELKKTLEMLRVMKLIKYAYIQDVPVETLLSGAIKGEVDAIGDPYSVYMDAKTYNNWKLSLEGSFTGVGLVLEIKDKVLCVVSPLEATPGERAGIISGDQILKIDGQETKNMVLEEAVSKIRGPKDTKVTLTIRHDGKVSDYPLVRTVIQMKTVSSSMLDQHIGYIRISSFNKETSSQFVQKLNELERQGMRGLVLDLRNNPGGLIDACAQVGKYLIPQGPIVSVVRKDDKRETYTSDLPAVKYPLVVLVNGGSASASEIIAGAVQDTSAGTLIGTKTFGKGTVQQIVPLDDGAVKLTIAKYCTPKERFIHGIGIQPDIVVENPRPEKGHKVKDLQKNKAIEVLKEKMK
jgi:carboxyl-terminal processing protease